MRAMVLEKPCPIENRPLSLQEVGKPDPESDHIMIKVSACGVCHTDLHTVEGDLPLPKLPIIPGHQVVGSVVTETESFRQGQRVGVTWFYSSCGKCRYCLRDRENLCLKARFTGLQANGGYAEYMTVPESSAFVIPEGIGDAEATPLLCGGVIGYRAFRLSDARADENLGMYGFGNSAHVTIQIAVGKGCRVYVLTRSKTHQQLALELGAVWSGAPEESPPELMQSSIIFAPAGGLVPIALRNLDKGGTLALAGITMTNIPEIEYNLIYGERTIRSVANTTRIDAQELLEAAQRYHVRTVIEKFPLDQANEVLLMMKQSRLKAGAVLIV
jgi:alcohol dehydrogenase, propanol-preferring